MGSLPPSPCMTPMNPVGWIPRLRTGLIAALVGASSFSRSDAATVQIDTSRSPASRAWADSAQVLAREWYPRLGNLMASTDGKPLPDVSIRVDPEFQGVAVASGANIQISANWITQFPDDSRGAVIHELVHVVQAYPPGQVGWLTEGVADYFRYAIYEALPLSEFPRPDKAKGYEDSYKVAAGFLFWLECGPAPGIVRQLNASLRLGTYRDALFVERTGRSVSDLWNDYIAAFRRLAELPRETQVWRHRKGSFERQADGTWMEFENGKPAWTFTETARTPQSIELLDPGRNLRLRITAQSVELASEKGWGQLYNGHWSNPKADGGSKD